MSLAVPPITRGAYQPQSISLPEVHEAIAATRPDEPCLVFRDRRLTWAEVTDRSRRLANALNDRGLCCHTERSDLADHESGQDHVGLYLHNGNEYLEAMLGAFKARVAPFNINYRYVADELRYLLVDAQASAVVIHSAFAPVLADVLTDSGAVPGARTSTPLVVLQVDDESGNSLLPGAEWYESALAAAAPSRPAVDWNADDLYLLYTGGTTGRPKGVMWRNGDAMVECFGGSKTADDVAGFVAEASGGSRALLAAPFMHGAGHWMSFRTWLDGGTVFVHSKPDQLDPVDIWGLVEKERLSLLLIVGDAFARPLLDELDRPSRAAPYDLSELTVLLSGGAPLSASMKAQFLEHLPTLLIVDGLGSSEAGGQLSHVSAGTSADTGLFELVPGNVILSDQLNEVLPPTDTSTGWLAKTGRLALGYLGDVDKTSTTYVQLGDQRFAVPGDRARFDNDDPDDMTIELQGRDSTTINSGGEKIFAEEVEAALKTHPCVYDCVVAGRPSSQWGTEVVAVVQFRTDLSAHDDELREHAARTLARYKLPKAFVDVPQVVRSPSGKADYRWASQIAAEQEG